jgi:hypothetical protein
MRITGLARLAAATMLLSLAACAGATTASNKQWPEFRMPGADFAVSMPEQPQPSKNVTAKDGSVSRTFHVDEGTIVYMVSYSASASKSKKPLPLDAWLDSVRNEIVTKMNGTLRAEHRLALGDVRGIELLVDVPRVGDKDAYVIKGRFYVRHVGAGKELKDILYQTIVVGDPGGEADASVARFLDSFHFVEG